VVSCHPPAQSHHLRGLPTPPEAEARHKHQFSQPLVSHGEGRDQRGRRKKRGYFLKKNTSELGSESLGQDGDFNSRATPPGGLASPSPLDPPALLAGSRVLLRGHRPRVGRKPSPQHRAGLLRRAPTSAPGWSWSCSSCRHKQRRQS